MKTIVRRSAAIGTFLGLLGVTLCLHAPQRRHLERLADLLVVAPRRKTLAELAAQELDGVDPSNLADFFRISPWAADDLRVPLFVFLLQYLQTRGIDPQQAVFLTLDDSLAIKDKGTRKLATVDWQFDHNSHRQVRASKHVVLGIHWGAYHFPLLWRLYLRASTVRRLNKKRPGKNKLRYFSKLELAQQMLEQVCSYLPPASPVYVLFDSWYTSAKLVQRIRGHGWHVIAGLKSNRKVAGQKLTAWHHALKGRRYERVRVRLASGGERTYVVRSLQGRLSRVSGDVRVLISQKGPGARAPRYFLCTDLTLTAQESLNFYQKRWSQEVDYWYVKLELGLGDFRLQSYEAIEKWYAVVYFVLAYLYWKRYEDAETPQHAPGLSEVVQGIRRQHQREVLQSACEEVARGSPLETVLQKYLGDEYCPAA
jgi:hypothetical protein